MFLSIYIASDIYNCTAAFSQHQAAFLVGLGKRIDGENLKNCYGLEATVVTHYSEDETVERR